MARVGKVEETLQALAVARAQSPSVLVAYSGGKDSLVVLDLCCRTFETVHCFYMTMVPGLRCEEHMLEFARRHWGVQILQVPHWGMVNALRDGVMCRGYEDMPQWSLRDIYDYCRTVTKCPLVATGAKRADSLWRRRQMATWGWSDIITPVAGWNKFDVLGYLKAQKLPIPDSSNRNATGIDLSTPSLLWLHDNHPEDFRRLCTFFPEAEAAVWRRTFFGVE